MDGRRLRVALCGTDAAVEHMRAIIEGGATRVLADHPEAPRPSFSVSQQASQQLAATHHLVVLVGSGTTSQSPWADVTIETDGEAQELAVDRLAPWAVKWHNGRRAPRAQVPVQSAPDPAWPETASRLIARLATHLTATPALRIDHIGSTSVPGLTAKNLIDIQVMVPTPLDAPAVAKAATAAGFVQVQGEWFGRDRHGAEYPEEVVVDADPGRPVNVNIRAADAPVARETLLFRDCLRADQAGCSRYAAMKAELTARAGQNVDDYGKQKEPFIAEALAEAEGWAVATRWRM